MIVTTDSMQVRAECVLSLIKRCTALRGSFRYSDQDARALALNNVIMTAEGAVMTLNLLHVWQTGGTELGRQITTLVGISPTTRKQGDLDRGCRSMSYNARFALLLICQFQIENCLRNIGRELGLEPLIGSGFYKTAKAVVTSRLGLSADRLDTLMVAAMIRNTLHSNGIHNSHFGDKTTVIDGVAYEFLVGKKFQCATWGHVAHALEGSIGVLDEVFNHPDVIGIPDPMFDQYVWEIATDP